MRRWYFPLMLNSKLNTLLRGANKRGKVRSKFWRRLWHLAGDLLFPILAFFIPKGVLLITIGAVTSVFIAWEIARFVSPSINQWTTAHLKIILKREEQFQPTGTTLLLLASLIVFLSFEKYIAITALLFVAIGDPVASLVGEKYGKHELSLQKTLEGSLACLIVCFLIGMLITRLSHTMSLPVVSYGAICATFIEALPIPLDDNFPMPLLSACMMALAALYL